MKNKNGVVSVAITVGLVLAVALVLAVLFSGISLVIAVLAFNVWRLAGLLVLATAILGVIGVGGIKLSQRNLLLMVGLGAGLILLPFFSDSFNLSLGVAVGL